METQFRGYDVDDYGQITLHEPRVPVVTKFLKRTSKLPPDESGYRCEAEDGGVRRRSFQPTSCFEENAKHSRSKVRTRK